MILIWATRGRRWGFRFLLDGGFTDPLPEYDAAFAGTDGGPTACRPVGTAVAVRFPDPSGRKDSAGRLIPHELVIYPPLAEQIHTVEDALEKVWPLVAEQYEKAYDSDFSDPR